jgi:hypothetical protein
MLTENNTTNQLLPISITVDDAIAYSEEVINGDSRRSSKKYFLSTGYGLMDVYLQVARLPANYKFKVNVLHGIFLEMSACGLRRSEAANLSTVGTFVHNQHDRDLLVKTFDGKKRFFVAPHPFHYVAAHYRSLIKDLKRNGSIFFWPHTLKDAPARVPVGLTIDRLKNMPEDYHPIDVCLHPNDISDLLVKTLISKGFQVISAGLSHDQLFMHRLFWLISRRAYCISADYGSHIFFSSIAGCKIFILKDLPDIFWYPQIYGIHYLQTPHPFFWPFLKEINSENLSQETLRDIIWEITGGNHWLTPEELRSIIFQSEKWGRSWRNPKGELKLPCIYWSYLEPWLMRYRSLRTRLGLWLLDRQGFTAISAKTSIELMRYAEAMASDTNLVSDIEPMK